jgi:UDP-N-acetylmuramate--alanine ligase
VRNPTSGEKSIDEALNERVAAGLALIAAQRPDFAGRWLFVDVPSQQILLLEGRRVNRSWPVSTAAAGLDNRQDSGGTPPGLHLVHRKIGEGAELDMIFESRELTGILWRRPAAGEKDPTEGRDLILTRVLTLDGQEEGRNKGPGVDSLERYIYIHGTNHEDKIGSPVSGGCVRMTNRDVLDLFDQVSEGDPVVIT